MGSFWLLKLALKCIDILSWPLLALGYPLFASIQAIETDSHSDTRNLISYWMLLSLIYLFEYAFLKLKLLQWFQYWPHIKLMIIIWLVIPDFRRASYVCDHLIHSCMSMNLQEVISRFMSWKKLSVKRESFLLQAEDYIKENGTEALEKLIASKSTMQNLDAEAVKAVPATEKNEKQQKIRTRLQMEQKDIKDLEMIEKAEVSRGKQANSSEQSLELKENTSTGIVETEGIVGKDTVAGKDTAGGESPQSSASKKVQKEWTCALCQVTTTSEKTLNIHLHGKKHNATCEALKAKSQSVPAKKNDKLNEEPKMVSANALKPQKNTTNQHAKIEPKKVQISNVQENSQLSDAPKRRRKNEENKSKGDKQGVHASCGMNDSRLRCEICDVHCTSEGDLASHLNGTRHLSRIKVLTGS